MKDYTPEPKGCVLALILEFENDYLFNELVHLLIDAKGFFAQLALHGSSSMIAQVRNLGICFGPEFNTNPPVRAAQMRMDKRL